MTGTYEKLSNDEHQCQLPGWWDRWKAGVKWGAMWRCDCGRRYRWEGHWAMYGKVGPG